jgi:hypothetical protein
MATTRHYAKTHRKALRQALQDELQEVGDSVVITAGNIAEKLIRKTLKYSTQFGAGGPSYVGGGKHKDHQGLRDADVEINYDVHVGKRGLKLKLEITVIDPDGKPHFVWHLISEGRKAFTQKKKSPPIRARRGLRTTPNSLEVSSFPGYSGDVFVIQKGQRVGGIPARNWYLAVVKALKVELKAVARNSNLKLYGIEFKSYRIRNFQ